jgi:hypothetical protein
MMIALGVGATLAPFAAIAALVMVVELVQRAQRRVLALQVQLTDAIHRELGAVASPVVSKRPLGIWRVDLGVPVGQPVPISRLVAITQRELAAETQHGSGLEIVLRAEAA